MVDHGRARRSGRIDEFEPVRMPASRPKAPALGGPDRPAVEHGSAGRGRAGGSLLEQARVAPKAEPAVGELPRPQPLNPFRALVTGKTL